MRKTLEIIRNTSQNLVRGPKKKAEASADFSKDYINIFKDKPDIVIFTIIVETQRSQRLSLMVNRKNRKSACPRLPFYLY